MLQNFGEGDDRNKKKWMNELSLSKAEENLMEFTLKGSP